MAELNSTEGLGLELCRILLGLSFGIELLDMYLRPQVYSNQNGILSLDAFRARPNRKWTLLDSDFFDEGREPYLFLLGVAFSASLAVGFLTKLSIIGLLLIVNSIDHRFERQIHAGFAYGGLILFFLVFSPVGSFYSLDQRLGLQSIFGYGLAWGTFSAKIQVSLLYLGAAYAKLNNSQWRNGTALYYILNEPTNRTKIPMPWFFANAGVSRFAGYLVIGVQLAATIGLWLGGSPRTFAFLSLVLLHLSMSVLLRLRYFPLYVLASLTLFF